MPKLSPFLLRLTLCGFLAAIGGCQGLAAVLDKTSDPKEPAKYVPEHENMVVVVEDFQNPALVEMVADHIDQLISEELIANQVAPVVNPGKVTILRLDDPDKYRQMKIPAIGYQLGAKQVLYVNITDFAVAAAGGTELMNGHAEARVRIVDTVTGVTRWPSEASSAGYDVAVDVPMGMGSSVTGATVREGLARALAAKIARLFYNANIDQPDLAPKYPETDLQ